MARHNIFKGDSHEMGKRIFKMRSEGKTNEQISKLVGLGTSTVSRMLTDYYRNEGIEKPKYNHGGRKSSGIENHIYKEVKNKEIIVQDVECEIIREGENTFTVLSKYGTSVVRKKPLTFVNNPKEFNSIGYDDNPFRRATGAKRSTKTGALS